MKKLLIKPLSVDYSELKGSLQTGDIILMKGQYVSSHIIELFEHCNWSHAAIVVLAKDVKNQLAQMDLPLVSDESILLWESNVLTKVSDAINGTPKEGPQLVSLHDRMKMNFQNKEDEMFGVRHLHIERTQPMFDAIANAIKFCYDNKVKFPKTKDEFEDPVLGRFKNKQTSYDHMFCSELVAYTYQHMGLLSTCHVTNAFIPADFSDQNSVGLLNRAWLGHEIIIEPKSL